MDADYASAASEADDEATLEEEDALAAQDGTDQKVCSLASLICSTVRSTSLAILALAHDPDPGFTVKREYLNPQLLVPRSL